MNLPPISRLAFVLLFSSSLHAEADTELLQQRLSELEQRVAALETAMEEQQDVTLWKDAILWKRIKKEMTKQDVSKILGKAGRIDNQIFTTWYYHPTSKLHSYVWFDEDKVLGWEAPK